MFFQIDFSHVRNYSLEECIQIFESNHIHIKDYVLMVSGKRAGIMNVGFIKILMPFTNGVYTIGIFHAGNMREYIETQVPSLTYIRETIFQFEDHLSFERSTFIIVVKPTCLLYVRLKCVRSILIRDEGEDPNSNCKCLSKRTQSQFIKCMQDIYTSYVRDLHGKYSKEEILCQLENDMHEYLKKFHKLVT